MGLGGSGLRVKGFRVFCFWDVGFGGLALRGFEKIGCGVGCGASGFRGLGFRSCVFSDVGFGGFRALGLLDFGFGGLGLRLCDLAWVWGKILQMSESEVLCGTADIIVRVREITQQLDPKP